MTPPTFTQPARTALSALYSDDCAPLPDADVVGLATDTASAAAVMAAMSGVPPKLLVPGNPGTWVRSSIMASRPSKRSVRSSPALLSAGRFRRIASSSVSLATSGGGGKNTTASVCRCCCTAAAAVVAGGDGCGRGATAVVPAVALSSSCLSPPAL